MHDLLHQSLKLKKRSSLLYLEHQSDSCWMRVTSSPRRHAFALTTSSGFYLLQGPRQPALPRIPKPRVMSSAITLTSTLPPVPAPTFYLDSLSGHQSPSLAQVNLPATQKQGRQASLLEKRWSTATSQARDSNTSRYGKDLTCRTHGATSFRAMPHQIPRLSLVMPSLPGRRPPCSPANTRDPGNRSGFTRWLAASALRVSSGRIIFPPTLCWGRSQAGLSANTCTGLTMFAKADLCAAIFDYQRPEL